MNLSEHFTLAEMTRTSQPYANDPGAVETQALKDLCVNVLEKVRAHFGAIKVNSGYRSPRVNAAVGSKPTSQHAKGQAADIECTAVDNATLARYIRDNLDFDQLILEAYRPGVKGSGWVHVSWKPGARRKECLTMTMGSHGAVYSRGINA